MEDMFHLILAKQKQEELLKILDCNKKTEPYGLVLSHENVTNLMTNRKNSLTDNQRVEFGSSILSKLIDSFFDSQYLNQDNYFDILAELQEIFYQYKNETHDELTDEELLRFMRKQFDEICFGDIEYLRGTCLERYVRATRAGYHSQMQSRLRDEYALRDTENEYSALSEETRWDYEVYKTKLEDMY